MLPRRPRVLAFAFVFAAAFAVGGAGCKQGLGDRCEQSSDCSSGMCSGATGVAAGGGHGVCTELGAPTGTGTGGAGGGGAGGSDGSAGADGSPGDAQDDGTTEAGADVAPGTDAAADAADDGG